MSADVLYHCVDCAGLFTEHELSRRGLCRPCSQRRVKKARQQILRRDGPIYATYKANMDQANERRRRGV